MNQYNWIHSLNTNILFIYLFIYLISAIKVGVRYEFVEINNKAKSILHFDPMRTGQPACLVRTSGRPFRSMLYQNAAPPCNTSLPGFKNRYQWGMKRVIW